MDMKNFIQERDAALLSLDEERVKKYCRAWGVPIPDSNEVFWLSVHKAICNITSASTEQRRRSAQWLAEHCSTPEILGRRMDRLTFDGKFCDNAM